MPALQLDERWTRKIKDFWYNRDDSAGRAMDFECPYGEDAWEPGPFGRFIVRAERRDEREIVFQVRDNEEKGEDEEGDERFTR